ncbi:hypothetical protein GTR04_5129 [Trichophyton interdigitale]|uniref:Uncharacterized protein n=1 Tax=Trichophyton interdigitale TaxID=101480 RepID=A0A9P4YFD6_9EURO|nr:hypothetical protein GY632_4794 [Trichophyton interdigitale]KAF3892167.1 hypothetical protein GY631_4370 [Trichophyton interdigitale]KAG8207487.1 hypothetical protein GTR04_5129 [Trichophyton interdigitale]
MGLNSRLSLTRSWPALCPPVNAREEYDEMPDQDQDQGRAKQRRRKSTGTAINWSTIVQRGSRGDYLRRKSFSRFSLRPANVSGR